MTKQEPITPKWSPRVSKSKIRRLYDQDSKGIRDEELVDEVGYALLSRCRSFIEANQAVKGRAACPICNRQILHDCRKEEILICNSCGWQLTWGQYFETIQRKQLSGAEPVIQLFTDHVEKFPLAVSYQEKMLLIDRLLHGFHWHQKYGATRPVAINLIQGRLADVIQFLDHLSSGETSTPGILESQAEFVSLSQYTRSWLGKSNHPILKTKRLSVRTACESDAGLFYELWTEPAVMRNVGFPEGIPITKEEIKERLQKQGEHVLDQLLVVELKENGLSIGECKLASPNGISEPDLKLLPAYWGLGYGRELWLEIIEYQFTNTDCRCIQTTPNIHNTAAIELYQSSGSVCEGEGVYEFPENMQGYTSPVQYYIYRLYRSEWQNEREPSCRGNPTSNPHPDQQQDSCD